MNRPLKTPPPYAVTSVDHALRAAAMLQLEGRLTVSEIALRLGVARSTAHRLLAMLVYRDFAVRDEDHGYLAGPVLELAAYSHSQTSSMRAAALTSIARLVEILGETANLAVRVGDTVRFIASVECGHALRVGSREGMVFPAHRTTAGMLLLAQLPSDELATLYAEQRHRDDFAERPDLTALHRDLARIRRNGYAVNNERSERGLVAVGVLVHGRDGATPAGLSVSMPSVRYDRAQLPFLVARLRESARAVESTLAELR